MRVEAGLVIGNRFRLLSLVSAGPFGSLWRAADRIPGKRVAIRIISDLKLGEAALEGFRREMTAATAVHHPSLARIFAAGCDSNAAAWVARELVDGEPLHAVLEREPPLSPVQALDLIAELAGALAEIHVLGLSHGAVSPRTILVRRSKSSVMKPRLIGLGRARLLRSSQPAYSSPEALASRHYSAPSDIWSLGVLLYRCVNGRLPFAARSAAAMEVETRRINRVLSTIADPGIRLLIADCFAHPDRRPNASHLERRARLLAREIEEDETATRVMELPVVRSALSIVPPPLPVRSAPPQVKSTPPPLPKRPTLTALVVTPQPQPAVVVEVPIAIREDEVVDFRPRRRLEKIIVGAMLVASVFVVKSILATRTSQPPPPVAAQAQPEPLRAPEPLPVVTTPPPAAASPNVPSTTSAVTPKKSAFVGKPPPVPTKKTDKENPYE